MKSPAHLPLDDSSEIHRLRRKRTRTCPEGTSVLRRELTITVVFAALLCNSLAIRIDDHVKELGFEPIEETRNSTPANTTSLMESAKPEMVAPTVKTTTTVVEEAGTCYSPECNRSASKILRSMDPSVKPCDDFFKFTCGGFVNSTEFLPGFIRVSPQEIFQDSIFRRVRSVVESESKPNDKTFVKKGKELYKACMIRHAPKTMGSLRETLTKLGGWPVLDGKKWNDSDFDWTVTIQKFQTAEFTSNNLFELSVIRDNENENVSSITIKQPKYFRNPLSMRYSPYRISTRDLSKGFGNKIVQAYYDYMIDVAVIMGADKDRARTELNESLWFEIELARIMVPDAKLIENDPITLSEMINRYPSVPWKKMVANLLSPNFSIGDNIPVELEIVDYIDALLKLMQKTSKRVQANYLMWRILENDLVHLSDDLKNPSSAFFRNLSGTTERLPPWKNCIFLVNDVSFSIGDIYFLNYYDPSSLDGMLDIIEALRLHSAFILHRVARTNETMWNEFVEKLQTLTMRIVDRESNGTHTGGEDGFRNPDGSFDSCISYDEDPFYIKASTCLSEGPYYNDDRPKYMNYGTLGFSMGSEISRGVLESTRPAELDNCIFEQYKKFHVKEVGLNLDEDTEKKQNVVNQLGAKAAYHAYTNWIKQNKAEPKLPGLDYTPQQMFWISLGNLHCAKYTTQAIESMTAYPTVYPPEEYKIFGSLSNLLEFAKDFNCPDGARMNPVEKCPMW